MNSMYDEWLMKNKDDQIKELRERNEVEGDREQERIRRKEKAKTRKKMWKEWKSDEACEVKMVEDKRQDDEEETEAESKDEGIFS